MSNPTPPIVQKQTEPNLADLLALQRKQIMLDFNCHAIATVQSFNPDERSITATINYKKNQLQRQSDGTYQSVLIDYPILIDVPIVVLSGGLARLTFPITAGDECLILFNDRSIDNWFQSGQITGVSSSRLHSFSDGIALIGVKSLVKLNDEEAYDSDRAVLSYGETMVGVGTDKVKIANALYTLNTLLQELLTELQTMTLTAVTPGIGVSGPPANAAAIAATAVKIGALLE